MRQLGVGRAYPQQLMSAPGVVAWAYREGVNSTGQRAD